MTKLKEIILNNIVYLAVEVNNKLIVIKPLSITGVCRRGGSNGPLPNNFI